MVEEEEAMTREEEMHGLGERKACFGYPSTKQKT